MKNKIKSFLNSPVRIWYYLCFLYFQALRSEKKRVLLVHSSPLTNPGGAEYSLNHYLKCKPENVEVDVILPDESVNVHHYDAIILSNLRPVGGKGEKYEYKAAKAWIHRTKNYFGHLVKLEHDVHPCPFRDASCINISDTPWEKCDCSSPIRTIFRSLYNQCGTVIFLSPLHKKVINHIIDIDHPRQTEIGSPIDFDMFATLTPWEKRKKAALVTGDDQRIADNIADLAEKAGYTTIDRHPYLSTPHEEMVKLYNSYQAVIVAPKILHAFGRVAVEAMACGCEVITNDRVGAISWENPMEESKKAPGKFWQTILSQ